MNIFIRAVVSGFGFSLGSALYKKVSRRLGFEDDSDQAKPPPADQEAEDEGDSETGEDDAP